MGPVELWRRDDLNLCVVVVVFDREIGDDGGISELVLVVVELGCWVVPCRVLVSYLEAGVVEALLEVVGGSEDVEVVGEEVAHDRVDIEDESEGVCEDEDCINDALDIEEGVVEDCCVVMTELFLTTYGAETSSRWASKSACLMLFSVCCRAVSEGSSQTWRSYRYTCTALRESRLTMF